MEQVSVTDIQKLTDEAFDALMERVAEGKFIGLTENGTVIAVLTPYEWYQGARNDAGRLDAGNR